MKKLLSILILGLAFSPLGYASTYQENIELARINSLLNAVYPLIDAAQRQADPNARVKFHYQWLRHDIQAIQKGIAQKINATRFEPEDVTPIHSSFLTQQNRRVSEVLP